MTELKWEDPPSAAKGTGRPGSLFTRDLLDAMRANPGRWLLVSEDASGSAGYDYGKRHPEFEVRVIRTGGLARGRARIYARFSEAAAS